MGLEQMLVQSAAKNPNKVVAYFKDQKITYGELTTGPIVWLGLWQAWG